MRFIKDESMSGVNKVILIGNVGRDPEVVSFDQVKKASFSLATTEVRKGKDGSRIEETEWHNIVCWRGLAETAEKFLKKGMQLYVEGKIRSYMKESKDGFKRRIVEIVAEDFKILSRARTSETTPLQTEQTGCAAVYEELLGGDVFSSEQKEKKNLSKLLSEDTEIEKLGDLPF